MVVEKTKGNIGAEYSFKSIRRLNIAKAALFTYKSARLLGEKPGVETLADFEAEFSSCEPLLFALDYGVAANASLADSTAILSYLERSIYHSELQLGQQDHFQNLRFPLKAEPEKPADIPPLEQPKKSKKRPPMRILGYVFLLLLGVVIWGEHQSLKQLQSSARDVERNVRQAELLLPLAYGTCLRTAKSRQVPTVEGCIQSVANDDIFALRSIANSLQQNMTGLLVSGNSWMFGDRQLAMQDSTRECESRFPDVTGIANSLQKICIAQLRWRRHQVCLEVMAGQMRDTFECLNTLKLALGSKAQDEETPVFGNVFEQPLSLRAEMEELTKATAAVRVASLFEPSFGRLLLQKYLKRIKDVFG